MKYEIKGNELPVVICYLESGEAMITERGSMSCLFSSRKNWEQVCSAERDLSCRNSQDGEWRFWNLTDM